MCTPALRSFVAKIQRIVGCQAYLGEEEEEGLPFRLFAAYATQAFLRYLVLPEEHLMVIEVVQKTEEQGD